MKQPPRAIIVVLLVLNAVVLLGQIWPAGAPPFARGVNIAFLALNALFLVSRAMAKPSS